MQLMISIIHYSVITKQHFSPGDNFSTRAVLVTYKMQCDSRNTRQKMTGIGRNIDD